MMKKSALWLGISASIVILFYFTLSRQKASTENGEALAKQYCSGCHQYPEPSLLPKKIWMENVLPEMGLRMGIGDKNVLLSHMSLKLFDQLNNLGVYPNSGIISEKEWTSILKFYADHAPAALAENKSQIVSNDNGNFSKIYFKTDSGRIPQTSMVKFIPVKKEIWMGSGYKELWKFNLQGTNKKTSRTPSPLVDMIVQKNPSYLSIGNMQPNEDQNGRLYSLNEEGTKGKIIIDSLHRPDQVVSADLNADGTEDLIVLEYGYITGQVLLVNGKTGKKTLVSRQPGARTIHIKDINGDGYPELFILFAQAKEQVSLFHNLSGNEFKEEVLLQFPSVHGSSYMDLADMNNDGHPDMILSFGDNADYSIINKNYNGVAIYLNDGHYQFKRSWFYPSYGATKTLAGDFDNDGDMDMAMIAFFSDPKKSHSFLYFEQGKELTFKVSTMGIPEAHWLVMDAKDMDGDGDIDLLLGNFKMTAVASPSEERIDALLLRNESNQMSSPILLKR